MTIPDPAQAAELVGSQALPAEPPASSAEAGPDTVSQTPSQQIAGDISTSQSVRPAVFCSILAAALSPQENFCDHSWHSI